MRRVHVDWADGPQWREDPREQGFIVDRGLFDLALVEQRPRLRRRGPPAGPARRAPSRGRAMATHGRHRWTRRDVRVGLSRRGERARRGRGRAADRRADACGLRLLARSPGRPRRPESRPATMPGSGAFPCRTGSSTRWRSSIRRRSGRPAGLSTQRFLSLLARSRLMEDCRGAELAGPVQAVDATPLPVGRFDLRRRHPARRRRARRSTRFPRAAFRRRSRARSPAPSSPTPCSASPSGPTPR